MTSLYIHIPFCRKKCFYCSFVVTVGRLSAADGYLDALAREARAFAGTPVPTIYLGGGTPTLIGAERLRRLMTMIRSVFDVAPLCEATIEANPEDITPEEAAFLKSLGFNRVSLGIQSFHDGLLKFLGRSHDGRRARRAFEVLRQAGFDNIGIDMMFALPGQTRGDLERDLRTLTALGPDHVSYYSLTIEKPSSFDVRKILPAGEERQAADYDRIVDVLNECGLRQYEVSNFSRPGKESAHNLNYWRGGDYIGLGVGAHSHRAGRRSWNVNGLRKYTDLLHEGRDPTEGFEILTAPQRLRETLTFGLRMNEGVLVSELAERYRVPLDRSGVAKIREFVKEGFLEEDGNRLRTTPKGRAVLDELAAYLI